MLNPGRCLVVGANGFIGSHLVDELISHNHKVVAFDRYTVGPRFRLDPNIKIVKGNVHFEPGLLGALDDVDYVFHAFSATTPFTSEDDPLSDIRLNLEHCVSFFNACANKEIKKVVYISSGGTIYGSTAEQKAASEIDLPLPVSPYGICKLAIENYLSYFHKKKSLRYLVFRVSNPYGPRQVLKHSQGVIPSFIEKIKNHDSITVYGDGTSSRDYIYVSDAVKMMIMAFENDSKYNLYNIGSGKQTTLNEIIEVLRNTMDIEFEVEYKPEPRTFVHSAQIDTRRFEHEFGLIAATSLDLGIKQML